MEKVILLDADSLLYKNIEDLDAYKDRIDEIISEAIDKSKADYYKIFIESPRNYTFRKILQPKYKSNRKGKPLPVNYVEIKEYIMEVYNPAVAIGIESDDYIISTLRHLTENYPLTEVIVCANDKDYKTYPLTYMDLYYGRYLEVSKITQKEAIFNFAVQMLMGDSADGVKCLEGIGVKGAEKLLKGLKTPNQYLKVIWREYRKRHKSRFLTKKAIINNYQLLRLRDDVRYVKTFDKVEFE